MSSINLISIRSFSVLFVGLVVISVAIMGWLQIQPLIVQLINLVQTLVLSILLVCILQFYAIERLLKPLIMVTTGGLGMLFGSILDFGQFGFFMLSYLCTFSAESSGLVSIFSMISLAPWTHFGMWLSCWVALVFVEYNPRQTVVHNCLGTKHLICTAAMLPGMWLLHLLPLNWLLILDPVANIWLGMSMGMSIAYFLLKKQSIINRV